MVYILILVAINPTLPSSLPSEFFPRFYSFALSVPIVQTSTGFWITLGAYILLSLVWIAGVCVWRDLRRWLKDWDSGSGDIEAIYGVAASFNYTCLRSFGHFSLLFRVQLAAFCKRRRALCKLDGTVCVDGALESFHWNIQNWPTVLLSTPRAGISLFVLLRYGTTAYGAISDATGARNSIYFVSSGVLSNYGIAILITNCCYAAYRILILLASYLGLLILNVVEPGRERARATRRAASQDYPFDTDLKRLEEASTSGSPRTLDGTTPLTSIQGWERRRKERIGLAWGISTDLASIHSSQEIWAHRNTSTEIACCTNDIPEHVTNTAESNAEADELRQAIRRDSLRRQQQPRRSLSDKEAEGMEERNDTPAEELVTRGRPTKWRGIAPYIISPASDNKDPPALDSSPAPFQPPMTVKSESSPQFDYFNPNLESPRLSSGPTLSVSQSQFALPGVTSSLQPSIHRSTSRDSKQLKSRFSNWSNGTNISLRLPARGGSTSVLSSPSPSYLSSFQGSSFEFPLPSPPNTREVLNCTAATLSIAECGLNISNSMPVFTDPFSAHLNRSPSSRRISRPGSTWRTSTPLAPCPPVERRQSLLDEVQRLASDREARRHNLVRDRNGRHSLPSGEIDFPLGSAGEVEVGRGGREDAKGVVDGDWFRAI